REASLSFQEVQEGAHQDLGNILSRGIAFEGLPAAADAREGSNMVSVGEGRVKALVAVVARCRSHRLAGICQVFCADLSRASVPSGPQMCIELVDRRTRQLRRGDARRTSLASLPETPRDGAERIIEGCVALAAIAP